MKQQTGRTRNRRSRYSVNIGDLHSLCETNYLRLLRVFPGYETNNSVEITANRVTLVFDVVEADETVPKTLNKFWLVILAEKLH